MSNKLQQYFPMIQTREEVMNQIWSDVHLKECFDGWSKQGQKEFIDFCTGVRGVKILYDTFFKEILNPEATPERIEDLLSTLLGKTVHILSVLPNDNSRIADESSLLIMDILVELEDGSLANVEAQKIGYNFPGERSACYSADLLLRQYKRIRSEKKKKFSYRDIKRVYTIVFFEESVEEFKKFPDKYIHRFKQCSDTGVQIELLQEFIFIPLDVFRDILHNNSIKIDSREKAWLAFLCEDSPDVIVRLIDDYPEFRTMYKDIYEMCRNVERIMGIFSKELQILDRNTVQLMIDEMQEEIDELKTENIQNKDELKQKEIELERRSMELGQKDVELEQKEIELRRKDEELAHLRKMLAETERR